MYVCVCEDGFRMIPVHLFLYALFLLLLHQFHFRSSSIRPQRWRTLAFGDIISLPAASSCKWVRQEEVLTFHAQEHPGTQKGSWHRCWVSYPQHPLWMYAILPWLPLWFSGILPKFITISLQLAECLSWTNFLKPVRKCIDFPLVHNG